MQDLEVGRGSVSISLPFYPEKVALKLLGGDLDAAEKFAKKIVECME